MRIALISDLHGNEVALTAVLDDIERLGADQVVCLGDVATLGPRPREVIARLRDLGCVCIMGNHDEFLLDEELIRRYSEVPIVVDAVDWCRDQLDAQELEFVRGFQRFATITDTDEGSLFVYHGSPRSHMEDILSTTDAETLDEMLAGHTATVMAGGHTHLQMLRQHRGVLVVNPGSLGLPFREHASAGTPEIFTYAEYALVHFEAGGVDVKLRRVHLNPNELVDQLSGFDTDLAAMLRGQYSR